MSEQILLKNNRILFYGRYKRKAQELSGAEENEQWLKETVEL